MSFFNSYKDIGMKLFLALLISSFTFAADFTCTAHKEWVDEYGSLRKEVTEIPVTNKLPGIVKLQLDMEEAFFSINHFEGRYATLSIVFPPNYTAGVVSRVTPVKGQKTVLNSINGSDVFKITCALK
jgi:hypothetical protein